MVQERFSASRFWEQVREAKATVVNFIGMMMPVLSKQPESPLDSQNTVRLFYGSPSFDPPFLQAFQERFGTNIIVGFGMTECCYGSIETIGTSRRPNSSGQPRQHPDQRFQNEVAIVDDGNPLPTGEAGEIVLRNPAVTPGYWRNEEQTHEALRDGWLHTGDMGRLDEDGFLYFVDRKKDVIRRRGENISSQEVEDTIKAHPMVLDCAVIAVPSELGEDDVKAYVTPRPGAIVDPRVPDRNRALVRRPPCLLQGAPLLRGARRPAPHPQHARPQGHPPPRARRPHRRTASTASRQASVFGNQLLAWINLEFRPAPE